MGCPCPQQREVDQGQYFFQRSGPPYRSSLSQSRSSSGGISNSSSVSDPEAFRRGYSNSEISYDPPRGPQIINDNLPTGEFVDIAGLFQIYLNLRGGNQQLFQSQDLMVGFVRFLQMIHQPPEQSSGLTQQQIQALRRRIASNDNTTCPICQETIKKGQEELLLDCYHTFHTNCLTEWLVRSNKCPMCRHQIA